MWTNSKRAFNVAPGNNKGAQQRDFCAFRCTPYIDATIAFRKLCKSGHDNNFWSYCKQHFFGLCDEILADVVWECEYLFL
jgi:hypothetical protein